MMPAALIPLCQITVDDGTQMRIAGTDTETVAEYAAAMRDGATFPAIALFGADGGPYWLADGFHRVAAARDVGLDAILADVRPGGQREAILFAVGANASHGVRRTAADKRRAVEALLRDPTWTRWSDREIAKAVVVDHKTVGRVRRDLTGEFPTERSVNYRDRHGNKSEMRIARTTAPSGGMVAKLVASLSDEALVAECRRRGLEVRP